MQMKYSDIYDLYNALLRMQDVSGFRIAWAVAKNIKGLKTEAEFFENRRLNLLKKYGKEKDGRVSVNTHDENFEEFLKEFKELSEKETDVELYKIRDDIQEDDIRSETARAGDYLMFITWIVEDKDDKGSEG